VATRKKRGLILGIESSCDETAAAVVRAGGEVLANVVASQMKLHANYGGVVPELASREHLRNIVPVVRAAMAQAGLSFSDLDAIAVTEGPGLAGALLVGITYAKALALGAGKPLVAVNHLEGHIHAVLMDAGAAMEMPLLALVVSGGHTHLYLAEIPPKQSLDGAPDLVAGVLRYRNVGRTVDDAAGEAFDKVAKLLGLGYPGGPWIDALAKSGNPRAVEFKFGQIKAREPRPGIVNKKAPGSPAEGPTFDFSFSGIKTAVLRYVQAQGMGEVVEARRKALSETLKQNPAMRPADALRDLPEVFDAQTLDLIASFQYAVVGNLMRQTFAAAEAFGARGIVVSGGVAANSELRLRFQAEADRRGLRVAFPTLAMSTDNAAMIAAAAWGKFVAGDFAGEGLVAVPQLKLGSSYQDRGSRVAAL
jgi:N6-L-threonylcarbamoyladenine synthase